MAKNSGNYAPKRGDLVWLDFSPTRGHEQSGKRPALVLSPFLYNQKTGLCIVCPMTSKIKKLPFEVFCNVNDIRGVLLVDHLRNIDYESRNCELIGTIDDGILDKVLSYVDVLLMK
ncbi:MAG: type II toxin-antitoxin system PemK/MazF family toxin [Candidatus Woesearchaeota archaeon]